MSRNDFLCDKQGRETVTEILSSVFTVQAKIDFLNFFWPEYPKFSIHFRRINRQVPLKKINFSLYTEGTL